MVWSFNKNMFGIIIDDNDDDKCAVVIDGIPYGLPIRGEILHGDRFKLVFCRYEDVKEGEIYIHEDDIGSSDEEDLYYISLNEHKGVRFDCGFDDATMSLDEMVFKVVFKN